MYHVSPFVSPGRRLEAVKVDEYYEFLRWSGPHERLFVSCADLRRPLGKFASPSFFNCHKWFVVILFRKVIFQKSDSAKKHNYGQNPSPSYRSGMGSG